jgi:ABC-type glycerol-3-phosphate transport system substrate-binding protein
MQRVTGTSSTLFTHTAKGAGVSHSSFVIRHFFLVILLSACSLLPTSTPPPPTNQDLPTATPTSVLENSTPVPATQPATPQVLRLWLPPQFAPDPNTAGGKVLQAQLAAFEQSHGWRVEVRVKKVAGQGGLLDSLHSSLQVAPGVSPDIIALDSLMLATEGATSSLQPLTQITTEELNDFYPVALQSARHNDALLALPFAVDILSFAFSTGPYPLAPQTWADVKPENGSVALPLNDPTGLLTLQQYSALGGLYLDDQGQPVLDKSILAQVLTDYQALQTAGSLPIESVTAASPDDTWTLYRENRASSAVVLFSTYLAEHRKVNGTAIRGLPSHNGTQTTFARQWNYALITTDPTRQAAAVELMRWLTTPDNLGAWSLAASILPARSRAFTSWSEQGLASIGDQLLKVAQPEPSASTLSVLGPALNTAVQSVLTGQATPDQAANTASTNVARR